LSLLREITTLVLERLLARIRPKEAPQERKSTIDLSWVDDEDLEASRDDLYLPPDWFVSMACEAQERCDIPDDWELTIYSADDAAGSQIITIGLISPLLRVASTGPVFAHHEVSFNAEWLEGMSEDVAIENIYQNLREAYERAREHYESRDG
jgi:hypothetical protein